MERIERLERANYWWRMTSLAGLVGVFLVGGYAFSQRGGDKNPGPGPAAPAVAPSDARSSPITYMNFARVTVTPEELILDLALNAQGAPDVKDPPQFTNRIIMNYFTAKRMAKALEDVVRQHETQYGTIELDFQKRLKAKDGR